MSLPSGAGGGGVVRLESAKAIHLSMVSVVFDFFASFVGHCLIEAVALDPPATVVVGEVGEVGVREVAALIKTGVEEEGWEMAYAAAIDAAAAFTESSTGTAADASTTSSGSGSSNGGMSNGGRSNGCICFKK